MTRGRFITVEGIDGVGKSTHLKAIRKLLADAGIDFLATREPGGTPLAEQIRSLALAERDEPVSPIAETLLIFAARAQHVATVVEPTLRGGRWVLCDRFTDSTFAYQCGGRGVDAGLVEHLAATVHGDCWPDFTLYLDAPPEVALGRIAAHPGDRFEREAVDFFKRVREVFRQRAQQNDRVQEVDATGPQEAVGRRIEAALRDFLGRVDRKAATVSAT